MINDAVFYMDGAAVQVSSYFFGKNRCPVFFFTKLDAKNLDANGKKR